MKLTKKILFILSIVGASVCSVKAVELQSFENASYTPTFFYGTGDWTGTASAEGFIIDGGTAASTSGFGQTLASSFDLTSESDIAVTLKIGANNEADFINVMLRTLGGSGTNGNVYTFSTADFNTSTFTTQTIALGSFAFQLGTGADLSNVDRLQVQGSGSNVATDLMRFEIQQVSVVPEPSTYALIFGASIVGLTLWLRRRGSN